MHVAWKKFALVDPKNEGECFPFEGTRVGLQLYWCNGGITSGRRPVIIDFINHPAGQYPEWDNNIDFKGICNNKVYWGDVANMISEGVATLRHSARLAHNSFYYVKRIPVSQANEEGFEIFY